SRGPHQAGMAYAVLATHRDAGGARRPVAGVAGASVGAVNALLTALLACTPDPPPTPEEPVSQSFQVDRNPLYDIWGDLDFEALFPGDLGCDAYRARFGHLDVVCDGDQPWRPGDALLSTNGLTDLLRFLQRRLTEGGYVPGCRMPLSVSLTAEDPLRLPVTSDGRLTAPAARRIVELELRSTAEGRIQICQPAESGSPDDRLYLRLPVKTFAAPDEPDGCDRIDPADLLAVVQASALPPPLLPPQPIDHCTAEPCSAPGGGRGHCHAGLNLCRARFTDGFLLDPIPLGPTVARLEGPGHRVIILDAEGGRPVAPPPYGDAALVGVRYLRPYALDTLQPVVVSYELQTLRRYQRIPPDLRVDTYTGPDRIFGDFAYGFAALVHPVLRRFDYYRGIVDGLRWRERERCAPPSDAACRDRCWQDLLREIGVEHAPGLSYVLHATLVREQCGADPVASCDAWRAELDRLAEPRYAPRVQPFRTLWGVLEAHEAGRKDPVSAARPLRFADFIGVMQAIDAAATAGPAPDLDLTGPPFRDFGRFWYDTLRQLLDRLSVLETRDGDAGMRIGATLAGMLAASRAEGLAHGWRVGSVSIPARAGGSPVTGYTARLLAPGRLAGITPGGVQLDWDVLTWTGTSGLRLGVLGAGLHYDADGPTAIDSALFGYTPQIGYRSGDGEAEIALRGALAVGRHVTSEPLFGPFHLGVELVGRWRSLALGLGSASLGCGLACHDPRKLATWTEGPLFVSIGLADPGGLLYWLARAASAGE
ncbi:MAG: hypothetical protein KC549_07340, partial [Myxococcales bacterium]|nr:hypothetical protein [Myxococcales bacterium]